jgi:hypothetical protein
VKPRDRVLEVDISRDVELLDQSLRKASSPASTIPRIMVRHASVQCQSVYGGRIVLARASAADPPAFDIPFDKTFIIDSFLERAGRVSA